MRSLEMIVFCFVLFGKSGLKPDDDLCNAVGKRDLWRIERQTILAQGIGRCFQIGMDRGLEQVGTMLILL